MILDGWSTASLGEPEKGVQVLRAGIAAWRRTGALLWLPMFLALEAEAHAIVGHIDAALQAIEQAIAMSKQTGECWAIAEILRVKAAILLSAGRASATEIQTLLDESIDVARKQHARSWELRSSRDLARLWKSQGREQEALMLLKSIYSQFTEGFDSADLIEVNTMMESLSQAATQDPGAQKGRNEPPTGSPIGGS
jgi:predicted ATPase